MASIKATRMEYLKLKRRQKTAKRGYKLLKEKRDGLMKRFMEIIREAKQKREDLENKFTLASKNFAISTSSLMEKELEQMFSKPCSVIEITSEKENIMSVWIPKFKYNIKGSLKCFSNFSSPLGMEDSLNKFKKAFAVMIDLAGIEHSARLLSFEIEKTRRRVNALEYVLIPKMKQDIKFIASKLDEQERSDKIVRMKVKDMIG